MKETTLQQAFARWLKAEGCAFIQPRSDKRSTISPGFPDFAVFLPGARVVFIETKSERGKVDPEQVIWHERLRLAGHSVHVTRDIQGCIAAVQGAAEPTLEQRLTPQGEKVIYGNAVHVQNGSQLTRWKSVEPGDERKYRKIG